MPAIIEVKNERKTNLENGVHKSIFYIHARQYKNYSLTQVDQQAGKDTNLLTSLAQVVGCKVLLILFSYPISKKSCLTDNKKN